MWAEGQFTSDPLVHVGPKHRRTPSSSPSLSRDSAKAASIPPLRPSFDQAMSRLRGRQCQYLGGDRSAVPVNADANVGAKNEGKKREVFTSCLSRKEWQKNRIKLPTAEGKRNQPNPLYPAVLVGAKRQYPIYNMHPNLHKHRHTCLGKPHLCGQSSNHAYSAEHASDALIRHPSGHPERSAHSAQASEGVAYGVAGGSTLGGVQFRSADKKMHR